MEAARSDKISAAKAKLRRFQQSRQNSGIPPTSAAQLPSPAQAPANVPTHAPTEARTDSESDGAWPSLQQSPAPAGPSAAENQTTLDMQMEISSLERQVDTLLSAQNDSELSLDEQLMQDHQAEIDEQLQLAHENNRELHRLMKTFHEDMERLAAENQLLSEQHERQMNLILELESRLQEQALDMETVAAAGAEARSPQLDSAAEQEAALATAEADRTSQRARELEAQRADVQIALHDEQIRRQDAEADAEATRASLRHEQRLRAEAAAAAAAEIDTLETSLQRERALREQAQAAIVSARASAEAQLAKARQPAAARVEETADGFEEQLRKLESEKAELQSALETERRNCAELLAAAESRNGANLDEQRVALESKNAELQQALDAERHTCTLLQAEVNAIPDYIELYHRERAALIEQSRELIARLRADPSAAVRSPTVELSSPPEALQRATPEALKRAPPRESVGNGSLSSDFAAGQPSTPAPRDEARARTPQLHRHTAGMLKRGVVYDFGPCRNCHGNVLVL